MFVHYSNAELTGLWSTIPQKSDMMLTESVTLVIIVLVIEFCCCSFPQHSGLILLAFLNCDVVLLNCC